MSNEEATSLIKNGCKDLIAELWGSVRPFVIMYYSRLYNSQIELCRASGVLLDDLIQEGYFALLKAIDSYKPERGYKLLTYMTYNLKNIFYELVGIRSCKRDALNRAISLHTPINDEGIELIDTIEAASEDMQEAERRIYNTKLHEDLEEALKELEPIKTSVIREIYYNGHTARETGVIAGIPEARVPSIKQSALEALRRNKAIRAYRNDIISRHAYKSSFAIWRDSGYSSTEWTAFKLLKEL